MINAHRPLLSVLSIAALFTMLTMFSFRSANAQAETNGANMAPEQVQHSAEELESLRSKLLELVDTVKDFSDSLQPSDTQAANNLARARTRIERLSARELNSMSSALDPSKMNAGLEKARSVLEEFKPALQAYHQSRAGLKGLSENAAGFPSVEGPDAVCSALVGTGRPSSELVIASDAVYMAAKIADVALNRACNQVAVAVILGEGGGGNASLACVASDVILLAAETLRNKIESCDEDFNKRLMDASVARLEHVHT